MATLIIVMLSLVLIPICKWLEKKAGLEDWEV